MAATPEQIKQRTDALYEGFLSDFQPLYLAVIELKRTMFKRIFGVGTSGGTTSEGQKLPSKPYGTKPIYVSAKSVNGVTAKFQFGKPPEGQTKGKPIKSMYFPNGYAQLKKETPAKLPLELTGRLKGGFFEQEVLTEGLTAGVLLPDSELGKAAGLQARYGIIFQPTGFEQDKMLEEHAILIAEQITNAMNKQ